MEARKAFVEVLDEVLAGWEPAERPRQPRTGFATPSIYFFATDLRHCPNPAGSPWLPPAGARSSAPPPPRRRLSPREQEALDAFVRLGADIGDDFTHAELRSVFRLLALRYHPDRHPGSSEREKATLSVSFAQLHHAYETLKSVPVCSN